MAITQRSQLECTSKVMISLIIYIHYIHLLYMYQIPWYIPIKSNYKSMRQLCIFWWPRGHVCMETSLWVVFFKTHHIGRANIAIGSIPYTCIWLVVWNNWINFPFSWECHHPNWPTPSFFRGVAQPPTRYYIYYGYVSGFSLRIATGKPNIISVMSWSYLPWDPKLTFT